MAFAVGLDLGQAADFTALAAVEQTAAPPDAPGGRRHKYTVRWLERCDLGTPYPEIVAAVRRRLEAGALRNCKVAADYTGVGRPVVDMLRGADLPCSLYPVLITAGHTAHWSAEDGVWKVPKKELVSTVQVLLQAGLLVWHPTLPLADKLAKELTDFRVKITAAANETFGAWRDSQHDDLVLAVALACWLLGQCPGEGGEYGYDREALAEYDSPGRGVPL